MRTRVTAAFGLACAALLACAGTASADAEAEAIAIGSPGFLSGNVVQIPIDIDANICGNSVNFIGAFNPAIGNRCSIKD
ncbi:hypothetical protein GCM10010313_02920 [Streptomyces violarus]|uniref:Chaplin domain-containing protein n=1 Tax=Streptomyces violarus TaxID=67380 RepID=A0A7W4ZJW4_9ACTN|nr:MULTISPECIES: chaplin [Streptomyces]MBB3073824.1 hypothetical protein [Streptomyces violarus]WRT96568.1 chaplin [Streptomyces sp. CGMCC 4.1772]GHC96525.1 hypothetical protein GCM10010313_02920 [Streptomyces violarus]